MFTIPSVKSTKTLFVINKDYYVSKEGEFRGNIQALTPCDLSRNKRGHAVVEYNIVPEVYDAIELGNGPIMVEFECEPREMRDRFGNMKNQDVLLAVVPASRQASATKQPEAKA